MATNLNGDQQRLIQLATSIAQQSIEVRRADIIEMVTIIRRLTFVEQFAVVDAVNDPQALRYLGSAGLQKNARARMITKLQELAAIGIK